jgi:hypothetical protein
MRRRIHACHMKRRIHSEARDPQHLSLTLSLTLSLKS